jgi:hypothetical protein
VARVAAVVPDLLFGSNVQGALRAGGHEVALLGGVDALRGAAECDVVVLDLTADADARLADLAAARPPGVPVLAFYSHVEQDVRTAAEAAGVDMVVPRSRMNREGPVLVDRLSRRPAS